MPTDPPARPDPPKDPTVATDGDLSPEYASYIVQYMMGADAPAGAFSTSVTAADGGGARAPFDAGEAFRQIKTLWQNTKWAAAKVSDETFRISDTIQKLVDLWDEGVERWREFYEGRDLDSERLDGRKLTAFVIQLRAAEDVMEEYRLGRLKETVEEKITEIKNAIDLILHPLSTIQPVGGSTEDAPGEMTQIVIATHEIEAQIVAGARALLDIIELLDLVTDIEHKLEANVLRQNKPELHKTGPHRTRKTGS
jgi:hypothetical protein